MTDSFEYIIGIDLGTTNCTMAYCSPKDSPEIHQFLIPQVMESGVQGEHPSLPSSIYFPLKEELKNKAAHLAWNSKKTYCVGSFAKQRGSEVPNRLIASAKSWLCHAGIDRRADLLPLAAEDGQEKMSPLQAAAELLIHLREAWDHQQGGHPFIEQQILITVPASFDPSARQLVLEAAELAGYPKVILLEEPQAAFYAWLQRQGEAWRHRLKVGDRILVVDIGGGTTDFTLIETAEEQGNLTLKRIAVGAHLLLGGDNIDLALAYQAKKKLEDQGQALNDWQLQALVHACQKAKESLLSEKAPEFVDLAIQGRGSRLIGGSLSVRVSKEEAYQLILDGFLPLVSPEERSPPEKRSGIQQIGLPYVRDPRISCQLSQFLSMTGENHTSGMDHFIVPTAVLFNGGTLKGHAVCERLSALLNAWAKKLNRPAVEVLPEADFDFAVSRGAVYYGLARAGQAIRIRGGTGRSYYICVEDSLPAVPGLSAPLSAVCVVPFGMEEGTEQQLEHQEFALVLGELATFRFFSRATPLLSNDQEPKIGTVVRNWQQELTELHPIETVLDKSAEDGKTVRIKLKSCVNEVGVLELWCVSEDGRQWKLEFDLREQQEAVCLK